MRGRIKIKWFLAGALAAALLIGGAGAFGTAVRTVTRELTYSGIAVTLDGLPVPLKDGNGEMVEPFSIDGTTYLPVRGVAAALGLGVDWDQERQTVRLTSGPALACITGFGGLNDPYCQAMVEGARAFAERRGATCGVRVAEDDSTAALIQVMEEAIRGGAKVLVCTGFVPEEAVYILQDQYPGTMFLMVDGQPHTGDHATYRSAPNVHCLTYREEQAGWLAGYGAVMEGQTKLGFLGGMGVPAVQRYGYGFLQGAEYAAGELGLAEGAVEIRFDYAMQFYADDALLAQMRAWYDSGTQVVFACGGSICYSVMQAAEERGGKVIGVDVDQSAESETVLTSAAKNFTGSIQEALAALEENGGTWDAERAGTTALLGAETGMVCLPDGAAWRFTRWTRSAYEAVCEQLAGGHIAVSDEIHKLPRTVLCRVAYGPNV